MKEVIVSTKIDYSYTVKVPDDVTDLVCYCDTADPVYLRITKILTNEGLDYEGTILDIVDKDTRKILYS